MALQRVTVRTSCVIVSLINRILYGLLTYHLACTGKVKIKVAIQANASHFLATLHGSISRSYVYIRVTTCIPMLVLFTGNSQVIIALTNSRSGHRLRKQ